MYVCERIAKLKLSTEISILGLHKQLRNANWEFRIMVEKSMTLLTSCSFGGLAAAGKFLGSADC